MFRVLSKNPSSGVLKTVTTVSGTDHISLQLPSSNVATWPRRKVVATIYDLYSVVTVLCTPDDGCGQRLKHVELSCSKIKLTANSCISLVYYNILCVSCCSL